MTVDLMVPDDARAILKLAFAWNQPRVAPAPNANGLVVRDGDHVRAALFVRESIDDIFVIDGCWPERSTRGKRALALLMQYVEERLDQHARAQGRRFRLAGVVRRSTPATDAMLAKRDYPIIALVRAKEFAP